MIMMGPGKDKGGMLSIIMEKMKKNHYEDGKKSNEDFMEKGGHDSDYDHYKPEVDALFDALGVGDKEKFSRAMKGFIKKCVSSMDKKEEDKY